MFTSTSLGTTSSIAADARGHRVLRRAQAWRRVGEGRRGGARGRLGAVRRTRWAPAVRRCAASVGAAVFSPAKRSAALRALSCTMVVGVRLPCWPSRRLRGVMTSRRNCWRSAAAALLSPVAARSTLLPGAMVLMRSLWKNWSCPGGVSGADSALVLLCAGASRSPVGHGSRRRVRISRRSCYSQRPLWLAMQRFRPA